VRQINGCQLENNKELQDMANFNLDGLSNLSSWEKKYYDMLLQYRDIVAGNMKCHAENALDASNADKRGVTTHMADVGSDASRHEMELQLLTEEGDVMEMISDAVQRLANHEYGKCHDCGQNIPDARLDAKPYAIYCVKCKSIREKHHGHNPFVD